MTLTRRTALGVVAAGTAAGLLTDTRVAGASASAGEHGRHPDDALVIRLRLKVHVWTIRNENSQLPADYRLGDPNSPAYPRAMGNVAGWPGRLLDLDIDGMFCDDASLGRAVLTQRENA